MIFDLMPLSSEKIYNSGEKRKKEKWRWWWMMFQEPITCFK